MRIHFIAIGGAVMHNLAIALKKKGYEVSGSDDEIFEPSRSRLAKYGLLPASDGWDPGRVDGKDAIILGMHARADNPELLRARAHGMKIYSFPEYLYEQTKDKLRVVIAGSHGKTTITAMVMHVLKYHGVLFDYMVGSALEGFETMTGLSEESKIAVFEGDEYLSSPLDPRPKFHLYRPHIAVITGISWDHMNVFPAETDYINQFRIFLEKIETGGTLFWFAEDEILRGLVNGTSNSVQSISYSTQPFTLREGMCYLISENNNLPVQVFGVHNMQNISAARKVCARLGISDLAFYEAIGTFKGTQKRLQVLRDDPCFTVYLDFAHAPSKVLATVKAVRDRYPDRELIALLELHTFSSLNVDFLPRYRGTLDLADIAVVYYNPHVIEHKKLSPLDPAQVRQCFGREDLEVYTSSIEIMKLIQSLERQDKALLIMSSGNFDGIDFEKLV